MKIHTEEQYDCSLKLLDIAMDIYDKTPDERKQNEIGQILDTLVEALQEYESIHYPMGD